MDLNAIPGAAQSFLAPCPMCLARGCPECKAGVQNYVTMPGKPDDYLGDPEIADAGNAWMDYKAGHRPVAGGMQDQTAAFGEAVGIMASVAAHIEELENAKVKAAQDQLAAKQKQPPTRGKR